MFALTYRIEKFKSSGMNPGKLESPLIGKISRGDTEDVSPAAEALQGTTNVFAPCVNLRATSKFAVDA